MSRSTAVDALTLEGSSCARFHTSFSKDEERFNPYARAVAVVSEMIFRKILLKAGVSIIWPIVQRPAVVTPEIAEKSIENMKLMETVSFLEERIGLLEDSMEEMQQETEELESLNEKLIIENEELKNVNKINTSETLKIKSSKEVSVASPTAIKAKNRRKSKFLKNTNLSRRYKV